MFIETHPKSKHSFLDWNSILFATNLFFKIVIREKRFFFGIDFSPYWPLVAFFFVPFVPNYLISVRIEVVCGVITVFAFIVFVPRYLNFVKVIRYWIKSDSDTFIVILAFPFQITTIIDVRIIPSKLPLHISSLLTKFTTYLLFFTNP